MAVVEACWKELKTGSNPKCPKLFYSFSAHENGYELHFTDLIGLWSERVNINEIYAYAKTNRTSIDPTEDKSQLNVLLKKLADSLAQGDNILNHGEGPNTQDILLNSALELPKPLQPLVWQFHLTSQGAGDMAEAILRPCLHEAAESMKRIESLFEIIAAKDRVISRLVEKLEGSSMDLSLIFPGITGARARKGQTTIKDAQRSVPGLKEFDKTQWQDRSRSESPYAGFRDSGLANLVSGCEKCPKHTTQQHERWLEKLPKATASISQIAQMNAMRSSSPVRNTSDDGESQFETQKRRRKPENEQAIIHDAQGVAKESEDRRKRIKRSPFKRLPGQAPARRSASPVFPSSPPPPSQGPSVRDDGSDTATASEASSDEHSALEPRVRSRGGSSKTRPLPTRNTHSEVDSSSPPPLKPVKRSWRDSSSSDSLSPEGKQRATSSTPVGLGQTSDKVPTPRKLGRISQARPSVTPEKQKSPGPSTQTTPHRLGRIGKASQSRSQTQARSSVPTRESDIEIRDTVPESDASTASKSTPSPQVSKKSLIYPKQSSPVPNKQDSLPDTKPAEEVSKEEKANRRREELKRKLGDAGDARNTSGEGTAWGAGGGGLRKKRKF